MTKDISLQKLTGLSEANLAEVFTKNPRAYMAVKGAVAEKHLEILLQTYKKLGKIQGFTGASGDFDKDFYVTLNNGKVISLECKNVQVLDTSSKKIFPKYIQFLIDQSYLEESWLIDSFKKMAKSGVLIQSDEEVNTLQDLLQVIISEKAKTSKSLLKYFPQELRESGVPRYEFSSSLVSESDCQKLDVNDFIKQFFENPLSIDFQRTRNSTDKDGDTRRQRMYHIDEIDVVGACLFSRTMGWQFLFGHSEHFTIHKDYNDRYANKLLISEENWSTDLISCLPKN